MFFLALAFILLVKGILVAAANNGGGVAGEMVPAMFIGAVAGCLFGHGINQLFGTEIPVWYMSLAAMGAMLGCSTHAPLMSVFILAEMTNSLRYMPAYVICALISYMVMKYLNPVPSGSTPATTTSPSSKHASLLNFRSLTPGSTNARVMPFKSVPLFKFVAATESPPYVHRLRLSASP